VAKKNFQRGVSAQVIEKRVGPGCGASLDTTGGSAAAAHHSFVGLLPPVTEEVRQLGVSPEYFKYLRHKIRSFQRTSNPGSCYPVCRGG